MTKNISLPFKYKAQMETELRTYLPVCRPLALQMRAKVRKRWDKWIKSGCDGLNCPECPYTERSGWCAAGRAREDARSSLQVSVHECEGHGGWREGQNACTYHMEPPFFVWRESGNWFLPQDVCIWMLSSSRPLKTLAFWSQRPPVSVLCWGHHSDI